MLDVTYIRENKDAVVAGLTKKRYADAQTDVDAVLLEDAKRKETQSLLDNIRQEQNNMAKQIGQLMKAGQRDEAEAAKAETSSLKAKSEELKQELAQIEAQLKETLLRLPNVPHTKVPEGNSEEDNIVEKTVGEIPTLAEGAKPHWELIKDLDIVDFELGNKVTGAGFPFYKGKGARLQRALINFFLDKAVEAGYVEVQTPIMVNEDSGYGTGQLPDKDGQMYHVGNENLYLIPTAEVPITNMYRDVIVAEKDLPVKHVGFTPCFRREAGSWGAHVRGLNRLHQFDKVEIVQIQHPDNSYAALEEMSAYVQGLLTSLELPFRVLTLCGGDVSFTSALTYDMEVYSAAQEMWLEVSSVSNFENYQANRLKLRTKDKDKKSVTLHTLNGSALALPRIMAAILENNQTPEGINIPKVLVSYTGFDKI